MNIYRHTDIYRHFTDKAGCRLWLPSYRHGLICKAVGVSVAGKAVETKPPGQ
jgi:hypothetical protein